MLGVLILVAVGALIGLPIGIVTGYRYGVADYSEYFSRRKLPPRVDDPVAVANYLAYYPVWPFLEGRQAANGGQ